MMQLMSETGSFPSILRSASGRRERVRTPAFVWFQVLAILLLCLADAMVTLVLLRHGAIEANPMMNHMIEMGIGTFLGVKYALTGLGVLLLVRLRKRRAFFGLLRVGDLLPLTQLIYSMLIIYEAFLLSMAV